MASPLEAVDAALTEAQRTRAYVKKIRGSQVQSQEDRQLVKAVALSWFRTHRPILEPSMPPDTLATVDVPYREILDASARRAATSTYLAAFDEIKSGLLAVRGHILAPPATGQTSDAAPSFATLAADPTMQGILTRRWRECQKCVQAEAFLAATVMMGGLLEALFVARANRLKDKSVLFKCKTTPIDGKTGKPLDLRHWTLAPYIDVGHELGWITRSAKDVAVVLRDYRNYVHPEKERSHGIELGQADARMFWELTKSLAHQLLAVQ
jgi:hypothetical protein